MFDILTDFSIFLLPGFLCSDLVPATLSYVPASSKLKTDHFIKKKQNKQTNKQRKQRKERYFTSILWLVSRRPILPGATLPRFVSTQLQICFSFSLTVISFKDLTVVFVDYVTDTDVVSQPLVNHPLLVSCQPRAPSWALFDFRGETEK